MINRAKKIKMIQIKARVKNKNKISKKMLNKMMTSKKIKKVEVVVVMIMIRSLMNPLQKTSLL